MVSKELRDNLETYFEFEVKQVLSVWVERELKNFRNIKELIKCPPERFGNNTAYTEKLHITGNYYCTKDPSI